MKKIFILLALAFLFISCKTTSYCSGKKLETLSGKVMYVYPDRHETRVVILKDAKNECVVIYDVPMAHDLKEFTVCKYKGKRYIYVIP